MKRILFIGLMVILLTSGFASPALAAAVKPAVVTPQTYTVQTGWENPKQGIELEAYFPSSLTIHVGDTVHWVQKAHEIHTVTFLNGATPPALLVPTDVVAYQPISPLMFNLAAVSPMPASGSSWNGAGQVNSGLLSIDPGQAQTYDVTFTQPGTYTYICLVHGVTMSGTVVVVGTNFKVKSPDQVIKDGQKQIEKALSKVPAAFVDAYKHIQPPTKNPDGSKTYHVTVGYSSGQIDLMDYFPKHLEVNPGDSVKWSYNMANGMSMAPHTVTFLNGSPDQALALPTQIGSDPFRLLINPAVLGPTMPVRPLDRSGMISSGLMNPTQPYTLQIGTTTGLFNYQCLLHDASGMVGSLTVEADN